MTCTRHFCYVLASLCGSVIISNAYINSAKANIILVLQVRTWRLGEVKELAQGFKVSGGPSMQTRVGQVPKGLNTIEN